MADNRFYERMAQLIADPQTTPEKREAAINQIRNDLKSGKVDVQTVQQALVKYNMATDQYGNISFQRDGKNIGAVGPEGPTANMSPGLNAQANQAVKSQRTPIYTPGSSAQITGIQQAPATGSPSPTPVTGGPSSLVGPSASNGGTDSGIYATDINPGGGGSAAGSGAGTPGGSAGVADWSSLLESAPGDAYFKDASGTALTEVTPGFMKGDTANAPAWQYYLGKTMNDAGTPIRDTYAADTAKDDFMAAEMVQRLLGAGNIDASMNPVDQLYGTQQLMGNLMQGGNYLNPDTMMEAMFTKVAQIEDPELQMQYINGALSAMKPYMSSTDYATMQAKTARAAENYLITGIDNPTQDKDFLGLLQGIR